MEKTYGFDEQAVKGEVGADKRKAHLQKRGFTVVKGDKQTDRIFGHDLIVTMPQYADILIVEQIKTEGYAAHPGYKYTGNVALEDWSRVERKVRGCHWLSQSDRMVHYMYDDVFLIFDNKLLKQFLHANSEKYKQRLIKQNNYENTSVRLVPISLLERLSILIDVEKCEV